MNVKWFLVAMAAVWCVCGVSQAGSVQVIPTQDATLESQAPDGPGGGECCSTAWNNGRGAIWRTMEQYDLSGFAGSTITAATYTFEIKGVTEPFSEVNFHPVTQAWSEEDPEVTWANYADKFDANTVLHTYGPIDEFTFPGDLIIVDNIDPAIFQNWIDNPGSNLGWMMKLTPAFEDVLDNKGWEWWSKDADEADGPAPFLTLVGDIVTGGPACDFDNSNTCDDVDIDLLAAAVRNGTSDAKFNVDGMGDPNIPDDADFDFYITDDSMLSTGFGDHDLNFMVNFNDFVKISNAFGSSGTGWDTGNGNTDDVTNFNDFVRMSNNFGMNFTSGSNVPEPMGAVLLGLGGLALVWRKR